MKNARPQRHQDRLRADARTIGFDETLEAAKTQRALEAAAEARTRAAAWPPASGSTSAARPSRAVHVAEDGSVKPCRRQPRYRRFARLHRHDGGRGARHRAGRCPPIVGRHQLDRLHPYDRRLPRDLRHRHGGDEAAEKVVDELQARREIWEITPERWTGRTARPMPAGANAGASNRCRSAISR